jgi:hypothetical protein
MASTSGSSLPDRWESSSVAPAPEFEEKRHSAAVPRLRPSSARYAPLAPTRAPALGVSVPKQV